jgi:hypothetical protein
MASRERWRLDFVKRYTEHIDKTDLIAQYEDLKADISAIAEALNRMEDRLNILERTLDA